MKNDFELNTPVVLITYLKMDTLVRVFESIRDARPKKLYHISDAGKDIESQKRVEEVISYVNEHIDWPCEVIRNYAEVNMGCRERIVSGLDWVFSQEDKAIILEDDILASKSFFRFCQEMLDKYENDDRIYAVSGGRRCGEYKFNSSYSFSMFSDIWGWATWKRAWQGYDSTIPYWPELKKKRYIRRLFSTRSMLSMERELDMVYEGQNEAWDPQWFLYRASKRKLEIVPDKTLMKNIGLDDKEATHSINLNMDYEIEELEFPLIHPLEVERNVGYDNEVIRNENIGFIETIIRLIIPAKVLKNIRMLIKK